MLVNEVVWPCLASVSCPDIEKVVSIGRLTAFYVVLVPLEYIPGEPPHSNYVIVSSML